jgi:hypothetical protein
MTELYHKMLPYPQHQSSIAALFCFYIIGHISIAFFTTFHTPFHVTDETV